MEKLVAEIEFYKFCFKNYISVNSIRSNRRDAETVFNRRIVAKFLRGLGFSYPVIGDAMRKNHTTIMMLADDDFAKRKHEYYMRKRTK